MEGKQDVYIKLIKKPKNPIIVEGFPGYGLVGTIATEYLLQHLDCELIGQFWFENLPATIAIHEGKIVHPIGIYYNKKYNLVIVHAILGTHNIEWQIADMLNNLAVQVHAKEIISLEGVGSPNEEQRESKAFYFVNKSGKEKVLDKYCEKLKEGIIIGGTSALLLKSKFPITAFFADTHSNLPDSKAAAKLITVLDSYLGLKVDPKPLLETAKKFEEKIKSILQKGSSIMEETKKKQLSYVG